MKRFVGLDVHKKVVEACVLDESGGVVFRERFELTRERLEAFADVRLTKEDHVVLEATTNTWAVVRILEPRVAEVVVSNPLATKAIAQAKIKTDKVDALVLAQLLRCDFLPRVWRPDEATLELRRLTSRRAAMTADRTLLKNRIHSVLAMRLLAPPQGCPLFSKRGLAWLTQVALDDEARFLIDADLRQMNAVEREIEALDQMLAGKAYAEDRVKLLMTLPGVDVAVAQGLLAALGDVKRFSDGDHAAGYLGLTPSTKQSADKCYHGPITKRGRSHTRWLLVQAAQHVRLHPGPLGVFFRRLARKKNYNVAVVATARKMVVIAWFMLTRNEPYRYALPQTTQAKLARLRVKVTGQKRPGGSGKGVKSTAKHGVPSRTIKSLPQLLQSEGLPPLLPLAPGEVRAVKDAGVTDYVASLNQERVVTRPKPKSAPATSANGAPTSAQKAVAKP